ncbi:Ldh family oxidoreductase [Gallicola sp. Sow4_E12]|uniref:Ldh family oxidoreductase n=1 Tax=Gallicola sp. Sow4_E12 TaxID=3438785 RepID=UPI003F8E6981
MEEHRYYIPWNEAAVFMKKAFVKLDMPEKDAEICVDVLLESDRRGIESHGCNRFKPIYIDRILDGILNPITNFEIIRETATTAVVDGHDGMGMVISHKAMKIAIEKAKKYGMGMVVVRNSSHYGIAGYYASMAAAQDMIGITGTNARPSVAPTFGVENMMGTNPLTFGMPTDEEFPFILDCATSTCQRGKIELYNREGKKTPQGLVISENGESLTDSEEILNALEKGTAALTPLGGVGEALGGYKGYGYTTVVEILSSALQAGSFMNSLSGYDAEGLKIPYHLGHFFMAVDIEAFMGADVFKKITGDILRELRSSKKAQGEERIYTAGEKEYLKSLERENTGIPIGKEIQKEFIEIRDRLGLDFSFSFEDL